jgi:shikimate kinase
MRIYLIGMPGSGKSSVGKKLANKINYQYIDMDEYIENKLNKKIPLIFSEDGEAYFRLKEKEVLNDFLLLDNVIISTGGGVIKDRSNKDLMNGKIIFIDVDLSILENRLKNDNTRPLLKVKTVKELYDERIDNYNYFYNLKVENIKIDDCVNDIIKELGL